MPADQLMGMTETGKERVEQAFPGKRGNLVRDGGKILGAQQVDDMLLELQAVHHRAFRILKFSE